MKRFILFIFSLLFVAAAFADGIDSDAQYIKLIERQKRLNSSQDSLKSLIVTARTQFETAADEQREAISQTIVNLEGEIYDVRSKLGRLGGEIAAIEQKYAERSLQIESSKPQFQSVVLYDNDFFKQHLTLADIKKLKSLSSLFDRARQIASAILPLYTELEQLKTAYDNSTSQAQVDAIAAQAQKVQSQITSYDSQIAQSWTQGYNSAIDLYLILLDKAGVQDRTLIEALESEGRNVRRSEGLAEQNTIAPNLAAFDAQQALILSYEKALASVLDLKSAANALAGRKIIATSANLAPVEFEAKVLTIYGNVETGVTYNSDNVHDLPKLIIPEAGNYYSIQISLLSAKPKNLDMFKGAFPLQYQQTADGKYRFMAGGFSTYAEAVKGQSVLIKAGYRYPVIVAWHNGQWISPSKAKAHDITPSDADAGVFMIKITTKDSAVAEKLRSLVDQHAKDKAIARIAIGDELKFTITEFESKNQAEALAQIIRLNVTPDVSVEQIK